MDLSLLEKYNVPVPRYTSYPTVPTWNTELMEAETWMQACTRQFSPHQGISLYIHLPYCEQLCTYCGCNKHITKNHLLEEPYIRAILKEWAMYRQRWGARPTISEIHLGGGTPTFFSPENLRWMIEALLADAQVSTEYSFSFEAHPHSTSYEHLQALYQVGFNRVSLGVQDFDAAIMRSINRIQSTEEVYQVTRWAREIGYRSVNFDLIYGLPGQQPEHMETNLRHLEELRPERIAFYSYAHVPSIKPSQRAYSEADLPQGREKLDLYMQGSEGLGALGYRSIAMDHFALPGDDLTRSFEKQQMHRNFMGYTPHYTKLALGLGASAISDSWDAYAQNEKDTRRYLKAIHQEQQLPIRKGHIHTAEDLRVRKRLLDIMCHYQAHWLDRPADFDKDLQDRLQPLEDDGLLKIFPTQVKITPRGRFFLRNVAAAFDLRMHRQKFDKPTFSQAV